MLLQTHPISHPLSPLACQLTSLHFGPPGKACKKVYIHAGLHADEVPGMLVAQVLRTELGRLEAAGKLRAEVVLVPCANPLGLAQAVQGTPFGRFDMTTGTNFNRAFRHVAGQLKESLAPLLGADSAANVALIRQHASAAIAAWTPASDTEALKKALLGLAIDADIVLDLHCDNDALMHVYSGTALAEQAAPLAAYLGAHALLVASEAGGEPFDEACSRLWWDLAAHFGADKPIPPACFAATVELRGEMEVDHALARQDAEALLNFLAREGCIDMEPDAMPEALCAATPLTAVEALAAPHAGMLVYARGLGARLAAGDAVAELIDPATGTSTTLRASVDGLLFARSAHRYLLRGMAVGKIAGNVPFRSGQLLSM